ncbi:McrC family protein [Nocardioides donggukensis]|uniref:Restriction endonuclease n=1 Tax=Nocardioides donggukensis TaxID=2774019 RepID=A0A927K1T6_9ACTN|nr:restriction endonuclease [Nocardioides donggukensis]MBD8867996.1 restriction endonuclease [Nocardioides donggukensis]
MIKHTELSEYETSAPIKLSLEQRAALMAVGGQKVSLLAEADPSLVRVRATSYVGALVLPGHTIWVRPKSAPDNLFRMLTVGVPAGTWGSEQAGFERTDDVVTGISEAVLRCVHLATARGLLRGYRETEERSPVLRGRLMIDSLARQPWALAPAPCRFDDFTADVWENRMLRAAVRVIGGWSGHAGIRRECARLLDRLSEADEELPSALLAHDPIYTRVNEHYRPALELARVVLRGHSFSETRGGLVAQSFMIDMNDLFERWVTDELGHRLEPAVRVVAQDQTHLAEGRRVAIRPDLVFRRGTRTLSVGDVKYKLTGDGMARSADYFQLLAYCTTYDVPSGVLIYCTADAPPDSEVVIRHSGQRLHCVSLPLHGGPELVAQRLERVAELVSQSSR